MSCYRMISYKPVAIRQIGTRSFVKTATDIFWISFNSDWNYLVTRYPTVGKVF